MFDLKCFELAEHFLADAPPEAQGPDTANRLAQEIQDAVEAFLEGEGLEV